MTTKSLADKIKEITRASQIKFIEDIEKLNDENPSPTTGGLRLGQIHDDIITRVGDGIKKAKDEEAASKTKRTSVKKPRIKTIS